MRDDNYDDLKCESNALYLTILTEDRVKSSLGFCEPSISTTGEAEMDHAA